MCDKFYHGRKDSLKVHMLTVHNVQKKKNNINKKENSENQLNNEMKSTGYKNLENAIQSIEVKATQLGEKGRDNQTGVQKK